MTTKYKKIGEKCAFYRVNVLKITQEEVAKLSGTSRSTVNRFENGRYGSVYLLLWYIERGLKL